MTGSSDRTDGSRRASGTGRRRLLSREERQASILRAAARAFAGAGFAGTSMEDVAAEAGVGGRRSGIKHKCLLYVDRQAGSLRGANKKEQRETFRAAPSFVDIRY